jgi:hypothetical protein
MPPIWPIQEGINLIQNELITLEEARFFFDYIRKSNVQSLFGS